MPTQNPRRPAPAAASTPRPLHTPSASLATLKAAHRRVSLARIGVGAALAAGPVALAVVCAMPHTVTATAQPTTTAPAALRNPDPAGVATLFCDLWLRSDATNADSTTAQAVAVSSARLSDGSWSVVVAAQFTVRNDISGASSAADADSSPTPGPARALVPAAKVRGDPQPTGPHTPSNDAITEGQFA